MHLFVWVNEWENSSMYQCITWFFGHIISEIFVTLEAKLFFLHFWNLIDEQKPFFKFACINESPNIVWDHKKFILYLTWHTGLLAYCLPCIVIGNNAEAVGEDKTIWCLGTFALFMLVPLGYRIMRCILRNKIREVRGIKVGMCTWRAIYIYDFLYSTWFLLLMFNREVIALTACASIAVVCVLWYKKQGWVASCQFHTGIRTLWTTVKTNFKTTALIVYPCSFIHTWFSNYTIIWFFAAQAAFSNV